MKSFTDVLNEEGQGDVLSDAECKWRKIVMKKGTEGIYYKYIKRLLDLIFAFLLAIPAFLVVSFCYVAIKIESKGPAFFVQERPGYKGKIFKIYKLRTMRVETEKDGRPLTDMERMTRIGAVIRACSFDELPQILNVIKGEMSFIGNRPLLVEYLDLYTPEQMRRHDVLPGISGWAQVNGRNLTSWEERFEHDIYYVNHVSFLMDVKIVFATVRCVFAREGINSEGSATMEAFEGMGTALHE